MLNNSTNEMLSGGFETRVLLASLKLLENI